MTRLDVELASLYPEIPRNTWQKYIAAGFISVNSVVATTNKKKIGELDKIEVNLPDKADFSGESLQIIYQDENVIVVNKSIGVLAHSKGAMNDEFTVAKFFERYTKYNLNTNRAGIVHRLDRDTSGVMIGALNDESASYLQKQFANRKVKKTYVAVLEGIPSSPKAIIDLPISRNPSKPSTFKVDPKGKSAVTQYEVLESKDGRSIARLKPATGRTHQLRVHMAYLGTPIVGDRVYGKPDERLYLHALSLEITIPGGIRKTFEAPLPDEFVRLFPKAVKEL